MTALFTEFPQLDADWRRDLVEDLITTVKAISPEDESVEQLLMDGRHAPAGCVIWGCMTSTRSLRMRLPARSSLAVLRPFLN